MTQDLSTSMGDTPAIIVLGTDALLAARPATPVQLAHACSAAGYRAVFPVSWGDELLAATMSARAARRNGEPLIACTCPFVAERFAGSELDGFLLSLTSPPVAAARYLREIYGHAVHITFVGTCPSAADVAIDARYAPGEFLTRLRELGIEVEEQPVVFESVIPPDRRRYDSLPGGVPTAEALRRAGATQKLVDLDGDDFVVALAEQLLTREAALIDVAPRLGCACAGATSAGSLRPAIAALEPPRARGPVVDASVAVDLEPPPPSIEIEQPAARQEEEPRETPLPTPPASPAPARAPTPEPESHPVWVEEREPIAASEAAAPPAEPTPEPTAPSATSDVRAAVQPETLSRRSPAFGVPRLGLTTPTSRTQEGRVVPRAYLQRRRPAAGEPLADERAAPLDRQAPIVTHVEPEPVSATPPPPPEPPPSPMARPAEVEIPLPRVTIPRLTATDVVPPPPIMPDPHFGDALIVADSLSELIGIEAASAQPIVTSDPAPRARVQQPPPPAAPPPPAGDTHQAAALATPELIAPAPAPPAPPPARPTPEARPTPADPASRTRSSAAVPLVPPIAPTPRSPSPAHIPPLPRAAPVITPKRPSGERNVVILPRRRRGTAAVLWIMAATFLALATLGARFLINGALASAVPAIAERVRPGPPPPPSDATPSPGPALTPTLPPVLVDSTDAAPDSAGSDSVTGASAESPGAVSDSGKRAADPTAKATPRAAPRHRRPPPPAKVRKATARDSAAPLPTLPSPARTPPPAAPAPSRRDSLAKDSVARDSLEDAARINVPRVTRPWPPPARR